MASHSIMFPGYKINSYGHGLTLSMRLLRATICLELIAVAINVGGFCLVTGDVVAVFKRLKLPLFWRAEMKTATLVSAFSKARFDCGALSDGGHYSEMEYLKSQRLADRFEAEILRRIERDE
jgi:hypothetical protein